MTPPFVRGGIKKNKTNRKAHKRRSQFYVDLEIQILMLHDHFHSAKPLALVFYDVINPLA